MGVDLRLTTGEEGTYSIELQLHPSVTKELEGKQLH